jgi:gluconolactonase
MCVDAAGNVYVTILGGVAVVSPSGARLGTISMTQVPTNCTFGGPQMNVMFITARTALLGSPTRGNSSIYRIENMPIPGIPGR